MANPRARTAGPLSHSIFPGYLRQGKHSIKPHSKSQEKYCKSFLNRHLQRTNQPVEGPKKPFDKSSIETTLEAPSRRITNDVKPGGLPPPDGNPVYKGSPAPQKPRMIPTNYREESEKT